MFENGLYGSDCLRLGYLLLDNLWREFHDNLAILHHLFYKTRTHHLTIIGNGIVEG